MKNLKTEKISKLFFKYTIPSIIGSLAIGMLIFIDTIFIGRNIGAYGLASLSILWPVFTLYNSLGLLIAVGAGANATLELSRGNTENRNKIFTLAIHLALIISITLLIVQTIFLDKIILLLGADTLVFEYVKSYGKILSLFAPFYILPHILNIFTSNDNNPKIAMWGMLLCSITNILLDYIFIVKLNMGMMGASLATAFAQVSYFMILFSHFFKKENTLKIVKISLDKNQVEKIIKTGLPSFLDDISLGLGVFIFNLILLKKASTLHVSALSIIINIQCLIFLFFVGLSQGCQPIISMNYGSNLFNRVKKINKLALIVSILMSFIIIKVFLSYSREIALLFIKDDIHLLELMVEAIPIFFLGTLFMGINLYYIYFFQVTEKSGRSVKLLAIRLISLIIGIIFIPMLSTIDKIWYASLFSEGITLIFLIIIVKKENYNCSKLVRI